ncbi:hypothetical protein ABPG77_002544 [Micractinium sp. CCAP 211/92]
MSQRDTPLHAAARAGSTECVAALLEAGADFQTEAWGTPLHVAAFNGMLGCLQLLLAAGASADAPGSAGFTPLYYAVYSGHEGCVAALLEAGADPSAATAGTLSATHAAALRGKNVILRRLLAAQPEAAVSCQGSPLQTPLHLAVRQQHLDCALSLLQLGVVPPAGQVLALLREVDGDAQPLYAVLAARTALTPAEWSLIPTPCSGLTAALPAVLRRSVEEACLLVQHLHEDNGMRLRCAALCLAVAQHRSRVQLPTVLVWDILALAAGV